MIPCHIQPKTSMGNCFRKPKAKPQPPQYVKLVEKNPESVKSRDQLVNENCEFAHPEGVYVCSVMDMDIPSPYLSQGETLSIGRIKTVQELWDMIQEIIEVPAGTPVHLSFSLDNRPCFFSKEKMEKSYLFGKPLPPDMYRNNSPVLGIRVPGYID